MKILILKPSSLGDVVQALPVLRLIKLHLPQSEVYWWLEKDLVPLLEDDRDLAGVLPFDRRGWSRARNWGRLFQSVRELRHHRFDWVIDLQSLARSGAFAWLANGALTVGLDDAREGARGFYDIAVRRPSYHTHAVDWYLEVLPHLGVPRRADFEWLPPRVSVTQAFREKWKLPPGPRILLVPGGRWLNKRWPTEYFAELVRQLAQRPLFHPRGEGQDSPIHSLSHRMGEGWGEGPHFVILGSSDEQELGRAVSSAAPAACLDLTGRTSVSEIVEWLRAADVVVTNDTGPMHIAAALGRPVVSLFGPTEPRRTGAYGQIDRAMRTNLPCVPCMKAECGWSRPLECLRAIPPDAVIQRVRSVLAL